MSKSFWRRKRQKVKKGQRKISKSSWRTKGETTWVHENYYLGHKKVVFSCYVFINFFLSFLFYWLVLEMLENSINFCCENFFLFVPEIPISHY